jgi:hypothetical protein
MAAFLCGFSFEHSGFSEDCQPGLRRMGNYGMLKAEKRKERGML